MGARVVLQMSDRDVVERAARLMGVTCHSVKPRRAGWSTMWKCAATGARADRVMEAVLPYMGERRTARIREILQIDVEA